MKKLLIIILCGLGLAACSSNGLELVSPAGTSLKRNAAATPYGKWDFTSYNGTQRTNYPVTLEIRTEINNNSPVDIISGKAPINYYSGSAKLDTLTRKISLNGVASTKIGGDAASTKAESTYLQRLSEVERYQLSADGKELYLYLPASKNLVMYFTSY